jgi:hypothetical protein
VVARQYDIALQQRYFQEQTLATVAPSSMVEPNLTSRSVNEEELRILASNLPSQFQPFEGLRFPLSSNQNLFRTDRKDNNGGQQPVQQPYWQEAVHPDARPSGSEFTPVTL